MSPDGKVKPMGLIATTAGRRRYSKCFLNVLGSTKHDEEERSYIFFCAMGDTFWDIYKIQFG